eukprot:6200040-Pleurochrysis_carterae.AAC.1
MRHVRMDDSAREWRQVNAHIASWLRVELEEARHGCRGVLNGWYPLKESCHGRVRGVLARGGERDDGGGGGGGDGDICSRERWRLLRDAHECHADSVLDGEAHTQRSDGSGGGRQVSQWQRVVREAAGSGETVIRDAVG